MQVEPSGEKSAQWGKNDNCREDIKYKDQTRYDADNLLT